VYNWRATVPGVLVKIAITGPHGCTWILQHRFNFKAFLIDRHVIVECPFFVLDNTADHVAHFILGPPYFQRKYRGVHGELPKVTDLARCDLFFLEVFAQGQYSRFLSGISDSNSLTFEIGIECRCHVSQYVTPILILLETIRSADCLGKHEAESVPAIDNEVGSNPWRKVAIIRGTGALPVTAGVQCQP